MAGVKGRSGCSRRNMGGARFGAGRPPIYKAVVTISVTGLTPLEFFKYVMNDPLQELKLRVRAAIAAAQYEPASTWRWMPTCCC
jgi:hypothetical protein